MVQSNDFVPLAVWDNDENYVFLPRSMPFQDLIIHVRDVSHPDTRYQLQNVVKVLSTLDLPENLVKNVIEIRNKIDLLPKG